LDGETVLKPQGWFNGIDIPDTLTDNLLDNAAPHNDWTNLSANQKASLLLMKAERAKYAGGNAHVLRFTPYIEVSHLNKLLIPIF
jgi:uncharacterized protein YdeI (YjbR/CyaY-like superfamily)